MFSNLFRQKELELPQGGESMFNYSQNPIQQIVNIKDNIIFLPTVESVESADNGIKIYYISGRTQFIEGTTSEHFWDVISAK